MEKELDGQPAHQDHGEADHRKQAIESAVRQVLQAVGEDPDREGLLDTPDRVARMYDELLGGYNQDLDTVVNNTLFDVEYGQHEMVLVSDIEFSSMCEHHMLPFTGKAHVAYIPNGKVIGLSKIPRIVDMFSHRLQVQERLTNEIADTIERVVGARGVMVVMEGNHACAALRGVKKHGMHMVTTARRGDFSADATLRDEFYRLIGK